jgi:hypothetical protein
VKSLDELIQAGNRLRGVELGSPKFKLWANDVREAVQQHGESTIKILDSALKPTGFVNMHGRNTYDERIDDVIELLSELKERAPEDSRAQDAVINQKHAEARASLQTKFNNITVQGDATFGSDSPISKVTVSEFMASLIDEVEALPDSEEKGRILSNLKAVLTNPTFASVSGSVVGELIKRLIQNP